MLYNLRCVVSYLVGQAVNNNAAHQLVILVKRLNTHQSSMGVFISSHRLMSGKDRIRR